jgi:hypothetical protein
MRGITKEKKTASKQGLSSTFNIRFTIIFFTEIYIEICLKAKGKADSHIPSSSLYFFIFFLSHIHFFSSVDS